MQCNARYCCCNSVRLSVTRLHCDKTKWRTADILIPHERQSLCYSDTNSSWWATPPSLGNLHSKWPPFEMRRLWEISAYNVTIRDSGKSSITWHCTCKICSLRPRPPIGRMHVSRFKRGALCSQRQQTLFR